MIVSIYFSFARVLYKYNYNIHNKAIIIFLNKLKFVSHRMNSDPSVEIPGGDMLNTNNTAYLITTAALFGGILAFYFAYIRGNNQEQVCICFYSVSIPTTGEGGGIFLM